MIDPDLYLTDDELAVLTPKQLRTYYEMIEELEEEWSLTPKQMRAEAMASEVDELMYGGAAGGGKTEWMLWHAYQLSVKYPGHRTLALRRTFPQLRDSLISRSLEKFVDPQVCRYLVGEKEWRFNNGSRIRFAFCDSEEDVRHYLSTEYDLILFEELTEFTKRQYTLLRSRNRTTARKRKMGIRPHTISATNPGQIGHAWVKERFVEATNYGDHVAHNTIEYQGATRDQTIAFVPARVDDNPHIDPEYVFNLASLGDVERRQYLEGDWDVFEGQYFTEFSRTRHVVELPFSIPEVFPRVRAIDYGIAKPFCCLWLAWDYDGNAIVYRERYGTGHTATEQAKIILEASKVTDQEGRVKPEPIAYTVADPSIWIRQGTGTSIGQMYRLEGLACRKAMNARIDGWSRVRDYLRGDGTVEGGARLTIFGPQCPNLVRTIPLQLFDDLKVEDLDTQLEDHAVDALRYGLMSRKMRAKKPKTVDTVQQELADDLEAWAKGAKRDHHPVLGRI